MKSEVNITSVESDNTSQTKEEHDVLEADPVVKTWPTQPKPLLPSRLERALWAVYDGWLITLPIALMIKTGLCIKAYHYDIGNTGTSIDNASNLSKTLVRFNSQLVTLFTILFVTIISTFVKRLALWKAQRGAYVTDLEQLQGSISLPSTLKLVWSLRSFGLKSILLVLVWSFYYLGSQAVKLEYQLSPSLSPSNMKAVMTRPDAPSCFTPNLSSLYCRDGPDASCYSPTGNRPGTNVERLNSYFAPLLLKSCNPRPEGSGLTNYGSENGPLMPDYYNALQKMPATPPSGETYNEYGGWVWTGLQSTMKYVTYTGMPIWPDQPSPSGNITEHYAHRGLYLLGSYTMYNTSYFNVTCGPVMVDPLFMWPNGTDAETLVSFNMTAAQDDAPRDSNGFPLREFVYSYRGWAADPLPQSLLNDPDYQGYAVNYNYSQRIMLSTCSISIKYVDFQVKCLETGCYPSQLRWSNNTSEFNATSYKTPFDDDDFATAYFDNLIKSTGVQSDPHDWTIVESIVMKADKLNATLWSTYGPAIEIHGSGDSSPSLVQGEISTALTAGMNTYYTLSQYVLTQDLQPDANNVIKQVHGDAFFQAVDALGAIYEPAYRIYWQWIPIDFIACTILLVAGFSCGWLRTRTLAPDIFGFVSSLTRENPHIQLPSEGSALNGIERARMLKKVKVKLGNVQEVNGGTGTAGTVGLATVQTGIQPLHHTHVYQ